MAHFLWTQKQDIGPQPRFGHAMTYDADRKCVLLFGGDSRNGAQGDTWAWDGENWTQVADIGPRPRRELALAYDSVRKRAVLFGGSSDDGSLLGDTWEWDGENWTQIEDTGPAPRIKHAMAYDSVRQCVVLFGGLTDNVQGDTWGWDGENWTQEQDSGPAPRQLHALAYDSVRQRLVLFGGVNSQAQVSGDTWVYDGALWQHVADTGPAACCASAMVFTLDRVTLFGGAAALSPEFAQNIGLAPLFGQSWQWDGQHWTEWQDIGPGPRRFHALAYDTDRRRIVLFGGLSSFAMNEPDVFLGDTWEHQVTAAPAPPTPTIASLVLNPTSVPRGGIFGSDTNVTCTVTLGAPQPVNTVVQITTDFPNTLPRQILIPAALTSGSGLLNIHTNALGVTGTFHVTASYGGNSAVAILTIT